MNFPYNTLDANNIKMCTIYMKRALFYFKYFQSQFDLWHAI